MLCLEKIILNLLIILKLLEGNQLQLQLSLVNPIFLIYIYIWALWFTLNNLINFFKKYFKRIERKTH